MRYRLENDILQVEIDSFGAELKSVRSKETNEEFMWQADAKYWGRTSPILFPFVGGLKDKQFKYDGNVYTMGQHGFARDMEHTLISKNDSEIWFELRSDADTLEKFPMNFKLNIGYQLKENQVKVLWKVENPDEKILHFSIGAHPAFNCPLYGETSKKGYSLWFQDADEIHHYGNPTKSGLVVEEDILMELNDHKADITDDFFDRCTYMIEGGQTHAVGIQDPNGRQYITVEFEMPIFAIWSPEKKNAPFICIEPWWGRCDREEFDGTLEEREYGNKLKKGEVFTTEYTMIFN